MSTPANPLLIVGSIAFDDLDMPSRRAPRRPRRRGDVLVARRVAARARRRPRRRHRRRRLPRGAPRRAPRARHRHGGRRARRRAGPSAGTAATRTTSRAARRSTRSSTSSPTSRRRSPPPTRAAPFVLLGNIHPKLQVDVARAGRSSRALVAADTMNFWISRRARGARRDAASASICSSSTTRRRAQLSGMHNLVRAAADIRKRGPKALIIKRGEFGALLFDDARRRSSSRPTRSRRCSTRRAPATRSPGGCSATSPRRGEVSPARAAQGAVLRLGARELLRRGDRTRRACSPSAGRSLRPGSRRSPSWSTTAATWSLPG